MGVGQRALPPLGRGGHDFMMEREELERRLSLVMEELADIEHERWGTLAEIHA